MLIRILEPEVMDSVEEAIDYDAMDHSEVNRVFVEDLLATARQRNLVTSADMTLLDVGTGTALIPIEYCRQGGAGTITAIDMAREMLSLAATRVDEARLSDRISLEHADAKTLTYNAASFDVVMSNSIVHHIPEPFDVFREMLRVLKSGGLLFVRDLMRPADQTTLDQLVETYAGDEAEHARQMFRDSLHAALTVEEVREILRTLGCSANWVQQTTDRHWTASGIKSA